MASHEEQVRKGNACRGRGAVRDADLAAQVRQSPQLDQLVHLTERLDRLPRHVSVHPCDVILSDSSQLDRTPVQRSWMGLPMSQFDKHDMDPMGLFKLDILGGRMHSAMAHAIAEHRKLNGCGIGKADVFRRHLGKSADLATIEAYVREHAATREFTASVIDCAWKVLPGFGSFGFAKAHGATFARTI